MAKKVKRLFRGFQPENYQLKLRLDPEKLTFTGLVKITGKKIGPPSKRVSLHQKDLKIKSAILKRYDKKGTEQIAVDRINTHGTYDELRLHSVSTLYPGQYEIDIEFEGEITEAMHGVYPCKFDHMGKEKVLLATQFESHHAREVFPCVDEPEAKATFDLTLITPDKQTVLSNTLPIKSAQVVKDKGFVETIFETTPRMSTYLLAFVVGEVHSVKAKTKDGIEVRTWATVAQPTSFLTYANDEAVKILEYFTDYFHTPFPLQKLDQVALPDFESGAMENWGLITYREIALLADPDNRSVSSEQYISLVVAHELSHQWFGNLVTMKWWNDLWLNESFASLMEHIALDALHPDWKQWEFYVSSDVVTTSNRDSYKDVQPVGIDVNHPDEIHTLFDPAIVYAKGGRLLKMLYDFIGEKAFRDGLKNYFAKHAYGNTSREHLWAEFSASSDQDISALMTPWLTQPGMPKLNVSSKDGQLTFSQDRFLIDGKDEHSLWPVPVLSSQKLDLTLLDKKQAVAKLGQSTIPIINPSGSGHYLVNYTDKRVLDAVLKNFIEQKIESTGRINLLNDLLLLCRHGDIALSQILGAITKCQKEPREAVWSLFSMAISNAQLLTEADETAEKNIKEFKQRLADYWYKKLGWDDKKNDDHNTKLLRQTAVAMSVSGESPSAIKVALSRFEAAENVEVLPSDLRGIIAGAAVRFGSTSSIQKLMDEYERTPNPDVQHSVAAALCSTKDSSVADKIVEWGLKKDRAVRPQDLFRFYAYLFRNRHTREVAWEWLKSNWDARSEELGGPKTQPYFIRVTSSSLTTENWNDKFESFFGPMKNSPALKRDISVAKSQLKYNIAWRKREETRLKKFLADLS